jgi:hypothetical protein
LKLLLCLSTATHRWLQQAVRKEGSIGAEVACPS